MKILIKVFTSFIFFCFPLLISAQDAEMADAMRSNGKIYVVVAIALIILFGLIAYLVFIDKKVTRLEKRITPKR